MILTLLPFAAGGLHPAPGVYSLMAVALDEFDNRQIYWARKASALISIYLPADRATLRARFEDRVEFLIMQKTSRSEAERISYEELRSFLKTAK